MTDTGTEELLRQALAADHTAQPVQAGPIIARVRRQRRRAGLVAVGGAAGALTAGLFWINQPLDTGEEIPELLPAGVVSVIDSVDIGMNGWQLATRGDQVCLVDPNEAHTSCAAPDSQPPTTLRNDTGPQIFLWVVPQETATAALQAENRGHIPADVYHLSDLDISVAIARLYPQDPTGWEHISADQAGEITQRSRLSRWSEIPAGQ
jgi:hypothetical protein